MDDRHPHKYRQDACFTVLNAQFLQEVYCSLPMKQELLQSFVVIHRFDTFQLKYHCHQ